MLEIRREVERIMQTKIKKVPVTVHFTPQEKKLVKQRVGKKLDRVSPYIRKVTLENLDIVSEDEL